MELFYSAQIFLLQVLAFITLLAVVVFIHEYGHYIVAKACGVKIDIFSIGFGKEIFGWNDKSGTRWKVCAVPLGGYVKMYGDETAASNADHEKVKKLTAEEKKMAFATQPLYKKSAIVLAGPLFNFLLAIVLLTGFFLYYGKTHTSNKIQEVTPNTPAAVAGVLGGDIIVEIDDEEIEDYSDIYRKIAISPNITLEIKLDRDGEIIEKQITPEAFKTKDFLGNEAEVGRIGVSFSNSEPIKYNIFSSFGFAVVETYNITKMTLVALGQIITGQRDAKEIGGPIRIAQYSAQTVDVGVQAFLWLIILVSANLGLVNLFPIPVLDGGHLLYYSIEAIQGKPVAEKFEKYGLYTGFGLLMMLMVFATFNDLRAVGLFDYLASVNLF